MSKSKKISPEERKKKAEVKEDAQDYVNKIRDEWHKPIKKQTTDKDFYQISKAEKDGWSAEFDRVRTECLTKRTGKFLLSSTDAKEIWDRDEAVLMQNPKLVRNNTKQSYTKTNCMFIEAGK